MKRMLSLLLAAVLLLGLAACGEEGPPYSEQNEMLRDRALMLQCSYPGSFWSLQQLRWDFGENISLVGLPNS